MNDTDELERLLRAHLAERADSRPAEGALDAVLAATSRMQPRRSWRRTLGGGLSTVRPIGLLAAGAALVLVAGAGILLFTRPSGPITGAPTPRPTPVVSAAPSASPAAALPAGLQHEWISAPRAIAGLSNGPVTPLLFVAGGSVNVSIVGTSEHYLGSSATANTAGTLALTLEAAIGGCSTGDAGTYGWSVTPDGATLTLTLTHDPCAERAAAFAGSWTRTDCRDTTDTCLGAVPAGSYVAAFFDVRSAPGAVPAEGAYGQLRYSVPAGWANAADWPTRYSLMPAADYAGAAGDPAGSTLHGIYLFARPAAMASTADCSATLAAGVGQTPAALAAWVAGRPGVVATTPASITVGGHSGLMLDLALSTGASTVCPGDSGPSVALLMDASGDPTSWNWAIGGAAAPTERERLIFLDLGGGRTVAIIIDDTSNPSRFSELVAQAMPVIATFQFPP